MVTICRAEALYEKKQLPEPLARVVTRRLEHIYSKVDHFFILLVVCLPIHLLA